MNITTFTEKQGYLKDARALYYQATKLQNDLRALVEKLQGEYNNACHEMETKIKAEGERSARTAKEDNPHGR